MVVTIQRELGERLVAAPSTEHYGGLSVLVQALADVEIVRILPPTVFWPRPKVESAIVQVVPSAARRAAVPDIPWLHTVIRRVFLHRRKNLRVVLFSEWRDHWRDKAEVDAFLHGLGLSETGPIRAEAMNVEEFLDLAAALKAHIESRSAPPDHPSTDDA
jgi:16S rRNA (adenine1518-N6/adenine1519-N6)-dimethyltransferase